MQLLAGENFIITLEGDLDAAYMSKAACIDKQYATMAKKSLTSSSKLDLAEEVLSDFEVQFGVSWESALGSGQVLGAAEAAEHLEMSDSALSSLWLEVVTKSPPKQIQLERSVSCCLIDCIPRKRPSSESTGSCWACMRAELLAGGVEQRRDGLGGLPLLGGGGGHF